jgi:hypothetical protein
MPNKRLNRQLAFDAWSKLDLEETPKDIAPGLGVSARTVSRLKTVLSGFNEGRRIGEIATAAGWVAGTIRELQGYWEEYKKTRVENEQLRSLGAKEVSTTEEYRSHHAATATEASPRDLSQLELGLKGSMHGPGWPSLSTYTQYWVLRVRLENLSDKPISFGDFYLEVDRDISGDPEVHAYPHIGQDTYGSHGGVPLADEALDKLISLTPERPVVEGTLRFQDDLPFDSDQVRPTLKVKGTGPHRGTEKSWELGWFH